MTYSKMILRSGHHVLDGGRWVMVSAHLRRLGIPYWVKTLRKHRAIRNGRYLTRAHLARRPRAFHPVRVGDVLAVWVDCMGELKWAVGPVKMIIGPVWGALWAMIGERFWMLRRSEFEGWDYVH